MGEGLPLKLKKQMKPLDTAVLIKTIFEGNEPSLNACSLPVVDEKKKEQIPFSCLPCTSW